MPQIGTSAAKLVTFHTRYKYLIQSHDELLSRYHGRLVAYAGKSELHQLMDEYLSKLIPALAISSFH
jgi:uncharacterized protein YbgA (DUF1722 family)